MSEPVQRGAADEVAIASSDRHRRRIPRQDRSRARVEAILAAARTLIARSGSDSMTMSEVASLAGVPIGSVYQYFPDKPSILRELALRFMDQVRDTLASGMVGIDTSAQAIERVDALIVAYHQLFVDAPDIRDMWAATQSDKELQQLDLDDSRTNGRLIAAAMAHLARPEDRGQLDTVCFLYAHLAGATARLALAVGGPEGDRLVAEFRAAVRYRLGQLLTG